MTILYKTMSGRKSESAGADAGRALDGGNLGEIPERD
jgi:hypothetical protein